MMIIEMKGWMRLLVAWAASVSPRSCARTALMANTPELPSRKPSLAPWLPESGQSRPAR